MKKESFYQTTTLPYVNAKPHIGFALEIIQADSRARFERLLGKDVFFSTGSDEHGLKIFREAEKSNQNVKEYVDFYANKFDDLKKALNLSYDRFIRTTDESHIKAAQELWRICEKNGYIYKKNYKGLYCVGAETFVTEKDLVNGLCPNHNEKPIEFEEENYFFKFSEFAKPLLKMYEENPKFIIPDFRFEEVKKFVGEGLEDFSISRLKEKMPWGVPVPGDDKHVMYVWFDALTNYISTLGWPQNQENFEKYWPGIQYAGKDQPRYQAIIWQAMLLAAKLPPSKQIFFHGFINSGGVKMSKSLGNVIDPLEYVDEFGADSLRYYLLRHIHPFDDSDFTREKFIEAYNANLANGLGNLFSRVMKMYVTYNVEAILSNKEDLIQDKGFSKLRDYMESFEFNKVMDNIWKEIGDMDLRIQETEPFKLIKTDEVKAKEIVADLVSKLYSIAIVLEPFLPEASQKIKKAIENKTMPEPLFLRK
jgi:methionyl-tRNA synthetase